MIVIDEILVSEDILERQFVCNIEKCKGACCKEGDFGAPLEKEELAIVNNILEAVLPYLPEDQVKKISGHGAYKFYVESGQMGTQLMEDGRCAFVIEDEIGVLSCAIEKAHLDGKIEFRKPISCHLYPIRITKNEATGFEAMNYDIWDICTAACKLGREQNVPVFKFAKEAIIRKYGQRFYAHLERLYNSQDQESQ